MTAQQPPYVLASASISHDAEQFRRMLQTLTSDRAGVYAPGDLAVSQRGAGANMSVDVAAGRVWMLGSEATYQGAYWGENRGVRDVTIAAADGTNPRRDAVVARVRDAAYSGSSNDWDIVAVTGTPAPSPNDPSLPANSVWLARVAVAAGASSILTANITDERNIVGQLRTRIGCELHNTATQTWTQTQWNQVEHNVEDFDSDGFHSTVSNTNRITIPTGLGGLYSVGWHVSSASIAGQMALNKNGNMVSRITYLPPLDSISWTGWLTDGDWIGAAFFLSSATGGLTPSAANSDGPASPSIWAYKVG